MRAEATERSEKSTGKRIRFGGNIRSLPLPFTMLRPQDCGLRCDLGGSLPARVHVRGEKHETIRRDNDGQYLSPTIDRVERMRHLALPGIQLHIVYMDEVVFVTGYQLTPGCQTENDGGQGGPNQEHGQHYNYLRD